jgi:hypothetical protein
MELPEKWFHLEVIKRIMHPSHHPFHTKTKSALKRWPRNTRPVGCFFRYRLSFGEIAVNGLIQIFHKCNCFQVTIASKFIWFPLTMLAGVI